MKPRGNQPITVQKKKRKKGSTQADLITALSEQCSVNEYITPAMNPITNQTAIEMKARHLRERSFSHGDRVGI